MIISKTANESFSIDLSTYCDDWTYIEDLNCYALEQVPYVSKPKSVSLQSMHIYVPAIYMKEDGSMNPNAVIGGYTAQTAPILYQNGVAGYMEAEPRTISQKEKVYLDAGFVYVSVGSRGRGTQAPDGSYIGKSPAALVDLKAGVRFLKANDAVLAGDTSKIISIGTSAGGAMSSLLGVTGNSSEYIEYLEEIGAVMDQTDDIFAAQCYCPIADLEHADAAYEWMFCADSGYEGFMMPPGEHTAFQQALSAKLSAAYPAYYNSLGLIDKDGQRLILGEDGRSGSGYDYILGQIEASASKHLTKLVNKELDVDYTIEDYLSGNYTYMAMEMPMMKEVKKEGRDLRGFLTWDGQKAMISDLDAFVKHYRRRLKPCTAFDDLEYAEAENEEFGNASTHAMHFNLEIAPILEELKEDHPEAYAQYQEAYGRVKGDEGLMQRVHLINPMHFIDTDQTVDTAAHFRIRSGTFDAHTSFTVGMNLACKLAAENKTDVDYALVWDEDHGEADYPGELLDWIRKITK